VHLSLGWVVPFWTFRQPFRLHFIQSGTWLALLLALLVSLEVVDDEI
jgi:hypothetical protein